MTRTLVLLAALVSATAGLLAPVPPAAAAAGFTVTTDLPYSYPRQVPLATTGQTTRLSVVVTSSEPVTVTARSYDGTLTVADPKRSLGVTPQPTVVSFDVAALTPGFHQLDVQVDGSTGPPVYSVAVGFPFVWTTSSSLFPGTNPLYGRSYGWEGTEQLSGLESSTRAVRMLTIVSSSFAYVGLPAFGRPVCTQEGNGCLPYAYDSRTHLLQVGGEIIAALHRESLYSEGLVPADPANGEPFGRYDFPAQDDFYKPAAVLAGTFKYSSSDYPTGLTYEKITFRKDHTFELAYAYDGRRVRKLDGTFRVGKSGAITFRSARGRVVQRGTVMAVGRTLPCAVRHECRTSSARPGQRGIWLILSGRRANHPDGNLLRLVR